MKIVVVIPTYNEAENIFRLIPALENEFKEMPNHAFHILVVDGNSSDGTGAAVEEAGKRNPQIHLLMEEKKAGLGAAYLYAFKYALANLNPDVLVEMDSDFQHDPKDLKKLIEAIDEGYDYVLGSRYKNGINIPREWAFYRKFLSVCGNLFTKFALGIFYINDFTTGFKASRVNGFVTKIDLAKVSSSGFAYKMDLLYKMCKLGARIKEVPIKFGLRDRGSSKMERDNVLDSLKVVLTIRIKESASFFKFLAVGIAGLVTDSSVFNILRVTILASAYSSASSGFVAMLVTYTLNNIWSFNDRRKSTIRENVKSFALFAVSSYIPILFRSWLIKLAITRFSDTVLVANLTFLIGVVIGLVWNFTIYSKIVWKKKPQVAMGI